MLRCKITFNVNHSTKYYYVIIKPILDYITFIPILYYKTDQF